VEGLQHRLVVLVLVLHHHLPDVPKAVAALEHGERAGADVGHELEGVVAAQVPELAAIGSGRLGGVVDDRQLRPERLEPACALAQPQVLEGGDVPEIPDQRAHQGVVTRLRSSLLTASTIASVRSRASTSRARTAAAGSASTPPRGDVRVSG
jgi:hypothetical protein